MQSSALKKLNDRVVPLSLGFEQLLMKARVQEIKEHLYTLKPNSGVMMNATRAASCLLQPEVGDQVLMCCVDPGEYFIVAVLTQADSTHSQISVAGDLVLQSTEGSVTLNAKQNLTTQSARWTATHHDVALTAHQANLVVHHVNACFEQMRYVAQWVMRKIDQLVHQGVSETRELEEHYSLKTKIHHEHASEMRLSESKTTLNRAKEMGISADKIMINS